jgi:hypothetical protein
MWKAVNEAVQRRRELQKNFALETGERAAEQRDFRRNVEDFVRTRKKTMSAEEGNKMMKKCELAALIYHKQISMLLGASRTITCVGSLSRSQALSVGHARLGSVVLVEMNQLIFEEGRRSIVHSEEFEDS